MQTHFPPKCASLSPLLLGTPCSLLPLPLQRDDSNSTTGQQERDAWEHFLYSTYFKTERPVELRRVNGGDGENGVLGK